MQLPTLPFPDKRLYSQGELLADGIIHVAAILAGLIAFGVLFSRIVDRGAAFDGLAVGVYALGFFMMFGFSCAYNMTPHSPLKTLLRRFDHAAIYIMIAGTYTALLSQLSDHFWGMTLLIIAWVGAIGGSALKLAMPDRWDRLSLILYLMLGWSVIIAIQPVVQSLPFVTLTLVVIGGLLYSIGVVFYKWHSLKFQNAIWHGFVAVAAGCHYAGIAYVMGRTV